MRTRLIGITLAALALLAVAAPSRAEAAYYVDYYQDNLFLGLANHYVGCLTNGSTIQSGQEYDGFTYTNYCVAGATAASVPNGVAYDWNYSTGSAQLNAKGADTNVCYATPSYQDRSNVCSYNVLSDCNSDCWMENFSKRQGWTISTTSGCWGSPPVASVSGISCDM